MAKVLDWDNLIAQAKADLKKGAGNRKDNAAAAFIFADGQIKVTGGYVCHAFMAGKGAPIIVNSLQEGSGYGDNPGRILAPEVEHWFVDYILNRSIYCEAFISKDAAVALEEQMVVMDGNKPGNLIGGAAVALRRLWEHVYVARSAYDLAKQGVNEDLAFAIGHTIQSPSNITDKTEMSWGANLNWHTSLNPGSLGIKGLANLLAHKFKPTGSYATTGSYRNYSDMYSAGDGDLTAIIRKDFPYAKCKGETLGVSLNPFQHALKAEAKANGNAVTYKRAVAVMAEWANTYLMERIKNA